MNAPVMMNDRQLHDGLLTIDSHIDIPWPPGPSPFEDGPRRVDLPKMRRGGIGAGCFAAYIP
jgi:membrane dipeptidase